MRAVVVGLVVAVFALSITVGLTFRSIADTRANGRQTNLSTWHTVICYLEGTELANPRLSVKQKQRTLQFWDHVLGRIDAPTCNL